MMQIYLVHPRHGKKIAMQMLEADADKKNGWTEVSADVFFNRVKAEVHKEPKPEKLKSVPGISAARMELVEQYKVKFDKAPHHRMSDASIQAALNESGPEAA